MEDRVTLSYFYGKEADQYSFYKIPKLLFIDDHYKSISVESKVLYGLMLDRMSLSLKNQWLDGEGRAYIYFSLEDIMELIGCSNKKAITIMKELDGEAGIGLIEKRRQGQGKPTIIYVKQFVLGEVQKCKNYTTSSVKITPNKEERNKNELTRINIYISERFKQTFSDFLDMRKSIKKPATNKAIKMIIMKLEKINS